MPTVAATIERIANTRQWIISRVIYIANAAGSGEPVFTLMDSLSEPVAEIKDIGSRLHNFFP
jgi:hypothetical protein